MKINEILVESQQLDEGPLDAIGRGVGKLAGGTAKAVGSVAGGVAGLGSAFMKGYRGGKATVAGDEEESAAGETPAAAGGAAPAPSGATKGAAPAAGGAAAPAAGATTAKPAATKKAAPQSTFGKLTKAAGGSEEPAAGGTASTAAPAGETPAPAAGGAAPAAPGGAPAKPTAEPETGAAPAAGAGGTAYAQAQKAVQALPPKQQKQIITMLQADPKVKSAMSKPAPAAKPAAGGAGAFGQMAQQLGAPGEKPANTMANAPVSKTNTAKPGNPNAAPKGNYDGDTGEPISDKGRADAAASAAFDASPKGQALKAKLDAQDAAKTAPASDDGKPGFLQSKIKGRKKAAPSQAEIDADREAKMGPTSDSIIRKGLMVSESFSFFRKQ